MSDWKNVQYKDGKFQTGTGGGGGGSSTFAGLDDVSFNNLQNGQVPKYNSETHKWENADESGGGGTVTDVEVDGVSVVNPQGVAEIETPNANAIEYDNQQSGLQATDVQSAIDELAQSSGGGGVEDVEVNGTSVVNAQNIAEIKSYKEVTQAEYNALPSSKTSDGVLYCIKDSAGADGFPPLIYSDEEREVGVWRDGRPLYQKTFVGTTPSNSTPMAINHNIVNVKFIAEIKGVVDRGDGTSVPIEFARSTSIIWAQISQTAISIMVEPSDLHNKTFYLTLQYTKTTDTAGSGTWTTQGGYAHHYSTTEQIIGTYNGKPLYQKSFFGVDFVNGRRDYQHGIANVDKIFIDNSATFIYKKDKTESGPFLFAGYNDQAQFVEGYGRIIQIVTPTVIIIKANANIYSDYTADITVRYTKTTD